MKGRVKLAWISFEFEGHVLIAHCDYKGITVYSRGRLPLAYYPNVAWQNLSNESIVELVLNELRSMDMPRIPSGKIIDIIV